MFPTNGTFLRLPFFIMSCFHVCSLFLDKTLSAANSLKKVSPGPPLSKKCCLVGIVSWSGDELVVRTLVGWIFLAAPSRPPHCAMAATALENRRLLIVGRPDIGSMLSRFRQGVRRPEGSRDCRSVMRVQLAGPASSHMISVINGVAGFY